MIAIDPYGADSEGPKKKTKKEKEEVVESITPPSPSNFPEDDKLRSLGYKIHSRPSVGPVLWVKDKDILTQAEALKS